MVNNFFRKYWGLIILAWGGAFIYRVPYMRYLMYEPLQNALNVNHTEFGNMMSVFGLAAMISYWPGGWLADRIKPRYLLCFSYLVTGLLGIYFATFPSYMTCIFIHVAWGVSTTLTFWAAMLRATKDMAPKEEVGRYYGLLESGRGLLTVGSISLCAWVFSLYEDPARGMSVVLNIMNVACLLGVPLTWFFFKDPVELTPNPSLGKDIVEVIKSPWIWCVALIVFSCYSAMVFGGYLTPYMTSVVGVSAATVTFLSGFWIYGSQFLAPPISGIISDKIGSRPKVMLALFCYLTAVLLLVIFIPASPAIWVVMVLVSASIYIGIYAIRGVYFAVLEDLRVPTNIVGAAIGFASLIGFAPDAFIYTIAGNILDNNPGEAGYKICFTIAAVLSVIGGAASMLVLKRAQAIKKMEKDAV